MGALSGKSIVITGAGRGIGEACAKAAAREGAEIIVGDLDAEPAERVAEEICAAGGKAVAHVGDISSWAESSALIDHCVSEFGRINGLVNNAGIFQMGLVEEAQEKELRRIVEINLLGTMFCTTHAVAHMIRQGGGSIVNLTSAAQTGHKMMSAYGATKGAVATYTYSCAAELAQHKIRVNAVAPSGYSRMADQTRDYLLSRDLPPLGGELPDAATNTPVMLYLLSDRSEGITGQVVKPEGTQLGLMTHPALLCPILERESWSLDSVSEAFENDLKQCLLPTGPIGLKVEQVGLASRFWQQVAAKEGSAS